MAAKTIYRTSNPVTGETVYFEKSGNVMAHAVWAKFPGEELRRVAYSGLVEAKKAAASGQRSYKSWGYTDFVATPLTIVTAAERDAEIAARPVAAPKARKAKAAKAAKTVKAAAPAPAAPESLTSLLTLDAPAPKAAARKAAPRKAPVAQPGVKYTVSATSRAKVAMVTPIERAAIREADMRAKLDPRAHVTVTTDAGVVVHEVAPTIVPGYKPKREALRTCEIDGVTYDVMYEHHRAGTETLRTRDADGKPTYYIVCLPHGHVHQLSRLVDDRRARRDGTHTWCPKCPAPAKGVKATNPAVSKAA